MTTEDKLAEKIIHKINNGTYYTISIDEVIQAMQEYHEAKLKEELINYHNWRETFGWKNWTAKDWIRKYLKQRKDDKRTDN